MPDARPANIPLTAAGGGQSLPEAVRRLPGFRFRLGLLLVVSREHGLMLLGADGRPEGSWHPVDYHYIEGAALVPGFGLVVCVDRTPGVLLVFSSIRDWPSLHHALAS